MNEKTWFVIERGKQGTHADQVPSKQKAIDQAKDRAIRYPGAKFEIFEKITVVSFPLQEPIVQDVGYSSRDQPPRRGRRLSNGPLNKGITFRELIFEILDAYGKQSMPRDNLFQRYSEWPFEGRSGHSYSPNTFGAEFGKMIKEGLVVVDINNCVKRIR